MHLTKSEKEIMEIFWGTDHPLTQSELVDACVNRSWKDRSVFSMVNSLMKKGLLREVGFVRAGKTYARTFEAALSRTDYLAQLLVEQLPQSQLPALVEALLHREDVDDATKEQMRRILQG
ncbi:MAG: BlaI/MecI/CopY family transcriptional regulator [Gemmiger sp.]